MKDMAEYIAECEEKYPEPDNRELYFIRRVAIPNTLFYEFEKYLAARNIPYIQFGTLSRECLMRDDEPWENRP